MNREIWKDIPGYEGYYQASNLGRVKSLARSVLCKNGTIMTFKDRILKPQISTGYGRVNLCKNGTCKYILVSQVVAMAFLGHKRCGLKLVVDHIDNNPLNDKLENLQIITNRQNVSKDRKGGTSKYTGVFWDKYYKRWKSYITINAKQKYLGSFKDEYKAHLAYQDALNKIDIYE